MAVLEGGEKEDPSLSINQELLPLSFSSSLFPACDTNYLLFVVFFCSSLGLIYLRRLL